MPAVRTFARCAECGHAGVMRAGAVTQRVLQLTGSGYAPKALQPLDWLRMGSLDGARALGLWEITGSLEAGKEADLIVVDPGMTAPLPGADPVDLAEPEELMSRLIFRAHPEMVRGAWVRGRLLPARAGQHRLP